jgi:hypothetical protein
MKSSIFNPLQLKHLMAHKGSYLRAIATEEGLRFCPDFAQNIAHVLDPIPVKMNASDIKDKDGRNITYMIEDGYQIAKLADALDFTKAEVKEVDGVLHFEIGKKLFSMQDLCASDKAYDLNIQGYTGCVQLSSDMSEAIKKCNIAAYPVSHERPFLQGVYLDPEDGTAVATDGRRMVYHKIAEGAINSGLAIGGLDAFVKSNPNKDETNDFILPTWVIPYINGHTEIYYAYKDYSEPQGVRVSHHVWSYWMLKTGGETYLFNPIQGQFPKWRKVAPEFYDSGRTLVKDTFDFEGMKRYKKAGTHDPMKCRFSEGTCTQMYNGEIELDISVKFPGLKDGEDMYCNAQFLIDGIKIFGKQAEVNVSLPEPDEGHILKAVDIASTDDVTHYVIMPMNA